MVGYGLVAVGCDFLNSCAERRNKKKLDTLIAKIKLD